MTKLLLLFSGFLSMTTASTSIISQEIRSASDKVLALPYDWEIRPVTVSENKGPKEWLYFAINNINLTSFGIRDIMDLRYWYRTIEISGLTVKYNDHVALSGDTWDAKAIGIGAEDWHLQFTKVEGSTTMILEAACTIWHSVVNRDLMMRLAYHAAIFTTIPDGLIGGTITFESGPVVKFY